MWPLEDLEDRDQLRSLGKSFHELVMVLLTWRYFLLSYKFLSFIFIFLILLCIPQFMAPLSYAFWSAFKPFSLWPALESLTTKRLFKWKGNWNLSRELSREQEVANFSSLAENDLSPDQSSEQNTSFPRKVGHSFKILLKASYRRLQIAHIANIFTENVDFEVSLDSELTGSPCELLCLELWTM